MKGHLLIDVDVNGVLDMRAGVSKLDVSNNET
jgi:hypothetical protein